VALPVIGKMRIQFAVIAEKNWLSLTNSCRAAASVAMQHRSDFDFGISTGIPSYVIHQPVIRRPLWNSLINDHAINHGLFGDTFPSEWVHIFISAEISALFRQLSSTIKSRTSDTFQTTNTNTLGSLSIAILVIMFSHHEYVKNIAKSYK